VLVVSGLAGAVIYLVLIRPVRHRAQLSKMVMTLAPSAILAALLIRVFKVSAEPDESMIAACVTHIGPDYFLWASDYPHVDAHFGVVTELRTRLKSLSAEEQAKVLGENAMKFYNLQSNTA
jgi:predicted TIM-barrel fold metal-dependent hydrolase